MPEPDFISVGAQSKACHNCRRRRLRCDKSHPSCRKCWIRGEECLGYGTLFRWANAPAVRGRLVRQLTSMNRKRVDAAGDWEGSSLSVHPSLLDPLLNHLNRTARHYVHHFATAVCRDLVSFDQPDRNPYRTLIPLASKFDFLNAIIVATGAMHLYAIRGDPNDHQAGAAPELIDALVAKDKAIRLLRAAVDGVTPESRAMVLAAIVFLVNLDLIDSGKGGWQIHMEAASALMPFLLRDPMSRLDPSLRACVDAIAADCLTYRVTGSAISGVALDSWADHDLANFLSILRRAEPYSYHGCPPEILQILLSASKLLHTTTTTSSEQAKVLEALSLVDRARAFDVVEWVYSIRGLSSQDDLSIRVDLALAHRATACLYVLLAVPEAAPSSSAVDLLVQEVLDHLAAVPVDHVMFKGTMWPTFLVGAQTDDPAQRAWCTERLETVWENAPLICPWGYIRTAVRKMQDLWQARDQDPAGRGKRNWLLELKNMREKCLIV
ncbi:hypothetical protein N657DRAFT_636679 [Parathielavia appendiculata]|uniref:Zn(2)-C6 fungal-type domain-containing protein n=1 Tax=Parathielavia appendiculata TaxID=2587402 RepID=A0AAN6TUH2_9PEZI|nr:hypothetical protein N657DRAFT_636679 [Parathielavia appendiculata]